MSEKVTEFYGENFHVYKNAFDEEKGVYLRLYSPKEFVIEKGEGYNTLTVLIDKDIWEEIKEKINI